MKKMKLVAVVTLLLATSAFGAKLTVAAPGIVSNPDGSYNVAVDATGRASITLGFNELGGMAVIGSSIKAAVSPGGKVRLESRSDINPKINDPTDGAGNGKYLEAVIDLGYTPAGGVYPGPGAGDVGSSVIATYNLFVEGALTGNPIAKITFNPVDLIDSDLNDNFLSSVVVNLVPEPTSMVLLAAGAAFFARRRRTA